MDIVIPRMLFVAIAPSSSKQLWVQACVKGEYGVETLVNTTPLSLSFMRVSCRVMSVYRFRSITYMQRPHLENTNTPPYVIDIDTVDIAIASSIVGGASLYSVATWTKLCLRRFLQKTSVPLRT